MAGNKSMRLSQLARQLNVGTSTIVDHLAKKGLEVENKPNSKITPDQVTILRKEFQDSALDKEEASELTIGKTQRNVVIDADNSAKPAADDSKQEEEITIKNVGTSAKVEKPTPASAPEKIPTKSEKLEGIKVLGKIDLDGDKKPKAAKPAPKPEPKKEEKKVEAKKEEVKKPVVEKTPEKKSVPKKEEVKKPVVAKQEPKAAKPAPKPAPKKEVKPEAKKQEDKPAEKSSKPKADVKKPAEEPKKPTAEGKPAEATKDGKVIEAKADTLRGLKVLGKIELPTQKKKSSPVASSDRSGDKNKKKRKRINNPHNKGGQNNAPGQGNNRPVVPANQNRPGGRPGGGGPGRPGGGPGRRGNNNVRRNPNEPKAEISQKDIQNKIKATIQRMGGGTKKSNQRSKYRRDKRDAQAEAREEKMMQDQADAEILKVTEFISANDLASLMDVSVNEVISACMNLGMFVSINQRLDAEAITIIADEFGFNIQFTTSEEEEQEIEEEEENEADLEERAPIVTIMGHVDHGKTSLLDYIRDAKVASGEAGGITQHIGAYSVKTESGKRVSFLDTPGHEAFTAMRARGAKLTDIVILVVAADDRVMPQTKEAINHAQNAGVPIIVAINKMDKPSSNPDKIREELSQENILVEDWGGKYQCQEVSAKTGAGIDELLAKVLIEAEVMELTANPNRSAVGTIVEASLDKGRGYLATMLVQKGTMKVGDIVVAGQYYGRVKALMNSYGKRMESVGPSRPAQVLGLNGAPQAGDVVTVVETDREARDTTTKRSQILREQSIRTKKHLTLDEIGRRLAVGSFKELNLIIKGDVDGSVEALTDSLLKLSTGEVQVNVIHKAVGQITESDVLLATASDAIIIGFQVRPSQQAKAIAETEEIEIRTYSVIYKAIDEMKDALEGLLEPTIEEVVTGNIVIREVFKITKIGTVAGCYVTDGFIKRQHRIRVVREGIVVYEGEIGALKRFKDDVSEVKNNYECGLSIKNFNDLKVDDIIEAYEEREVKRKL